VQCWKVQESLENSKDKGFWKSVGEGKASIHREGKQRFKAARRGQMTVEDNRYLLVSADVPQEAVILPERIRYLSKSQGHIFRTKEGTPIEGPMPLQEMLDEVNRVFTNETQRASQEATWAISREVGESNWRMPSKLEWTPYWEHMVIRPCYQVKVTAWFGMSAHYSEELILRRCLVWEDFQFLVDSRLKDQEWEAWIDNQRWTGARGELDCSIFTRPGRPVYVFPPSAATEYKREIQRGREEEAWKRVQGILSFMPWYSCLSRYVEGQDVTVILKNHNGPGESFVRVPTGSELAFIKSLANKRMGQGNWIASLRAERWSDHSRKPRYGDIVRLYPIEEKPLVYPSAAKSVTTKDEEKLLTHSSMPKVTLPKAEEVQIIPKAVEPSDPPPANWTGDLKAPVEKIQQRTQRPLPNARIIVELAVPLIEILSPMLAKPLDEGERPRLLSLEEVRWKTEYHQKSWEAYIRWGTAINSRLSSAQMMKAWKEAKEKVDPACLHEGYHRRFWEALRKKQSEEWDDLLKYDIAGMQRRDKGTYFEAELLTLHNDDITYEERVRRLETLPEVAVNGAFEWFSKLQLPRVNWNDEDIPDGLSSEDWDDWRTRFREARKSLEDLPQRHLEQVRLRSQAWFEETKKKWFGLLKEAIQVEKNWESRFREISELKLNVCKSKFEAGAAQASIRNCSRKIAEISYEWVNHKPVQDGRRGYHVRTQAEVSYLFRELSQEKRLKEETFGDASFRVVKNQERLKTFLKALEAVATYLKDLKACWRRI
jgi:hypothetical protein